MRKWALQGAATSAIKKIWMWLEKVNRGWTNSFVYFICSVFSFFLFVVFLISSSYVSLLLWRVGVCLCLVCCVGWCVCVCGGGGWGGGGGGGGGLDWRMTHSSGLTGTSVTCDSTGLSYWLKEQTKEIAFSSNSTPLFQQWQKTFLFSKRNVSLSKGD